MTLFVGLNVSPEKTANCAFSEHGKIVREAQVASEPEALARWIENLDGIIAVVGLEAGPCRSGCIVAAGPEYGADKDPAGEGCSEGDADQDGPTGCRRHCAPASSWLVPARSLQIRLRTRQVRTLLSARKAVQQGFITLELSLRGLLRNFGKVGAISRGRFGHRIRALTADNPMLFAATGPMLRAQASLGQQLAGLERRVRQVAQDDPVCRRLMSMPGVGAVVALTYRAAVDDSSWFTLSKKVGPWVGLTPARNPSDDRDISGGITKAGDVILRRALYRAVTVMMYEEGQKAVQWTVFPTIGGRSTWLRPWAVQIARRRGAKRAMVALARRISVILHRIWTDGTTFRSEVQVPHAT